MDSTRTLAGWLADLVMRGPSGEARATLTFGDDGSPSLLVVTTPTKGKLREKVHTPKRFQSELGEWATTHLVDKALLDLMAKGFVGKGADPRGSRGLSLLLGTEIGPPMGAAFAVDEARNIAWLGDWGFLRKVDLLTGLVTSLSLGDYPAVREMRIGPDGAVWLLADRDTEKPEGPYRAPAGPKVAFGVLRMGAGSPFAPGAIEERLVVSVPRNAAPRICTCLSLARDGAMLVPDEEGFAHLRKDGTLVKTYASAMLTHGGAVAALSPDGRTIAVTSAVGRIDVHDVKSGAVRTEKLEMEDASSLVVHDDGTVDVGTRGPDHHFHRIPAKGATLTVPDRAAHYTAAPPGSDRPFVYAAMDGALTRFKLSGESEAIYPVIGGSRGSRVFLGENDIYVHTARGVLMRIGMTPSRGDAEAEVPRSQRSAPEVP